MSISIDKKNQDDVLCLSLTGRFDAVSAPEVEKEVKTILESQAKKVVIDLSGVSYISSAGLRVLLVAIKGVQQLGGKLILSGLSENVKDVFKISGFLNIFAIADNQEMALTQF